MLPFYMNKGYSSLYRTVRKPTWPPLRAETLSDPFLKPNVKFLHVQFIVLSSSLGNSSDRTLSSQTGHITKELGI